MWRSRLLVRSSTFITKSLHKNRLCFSSNPNKNSKQITIGIISVSGLAIVGTVVYAKYDPKLKHFLETNVPYIDRVYKMFSDNETKESKSDESYFSKKILNVVDKNVTDPVKKLHLGRSTTNDKSNPGVDKAKIVIDSKVTEDTLKSPVAKEVIASYEDDLNKAILKLNKYFGEGIVAYKFAANAIKFYDEKLNEAFKFSALNAATSKQVNDARLEKEKLLNFAKKKTEEIKNVFENLKNNSKQLSEQGICNPLIESAEKLASKCLLKLQNGESELKATGKEEAKEVSEFEKILKSTKELFETELKIIFPNKLKVGNDIGIVEDDLSLIISHAHNKIEQLQEQIATMQETGKGKIDKDMENQKTLDELLSNTEKQEYLNNIIENRLAPMKAEFESELQKTLLRQITAHADHLQKSLELQEQELERKHKLDLNEKLSHQTEAFVSETSQNVFRLKKITEYIKTQNEYNKSTEKVQNLWLACQAMCHKMESENLNPLAKDVEQIKILVDENNDFVNSIIDSIPVIALDRGVFTVDILKQKFEKVKDTCQKVALIDVNNDSLYRYVLSYLQSFLIIDTVPNREELVSKADVDTSKLDTFDNLRKITYFLKTGNLEQSLRFANQLKGEPRAVAQDWINELTHLLETRLAFKALLAYASAINVQVYH